MSSNDRKHSSKEYSGKHRPTSYGDMKSIPDNERKRSSDRRRVSIEKDDEIVKEKIENKLKKNRIEDKQKDRVEKKAFKTEIESEEEKRRRHRAEKDEIRQPRRERDIEREEKTHKSQRDVDKEDRKNRREKDGEGEERRLKREKESEQGNGKIKKEKENKEGERRKHREESNDGIEHSKNRSDRHRERDDRKKNEGENDGEKRRQKSEHRSGESDEVRRKRKEKEKDDIANYVRSRNGTSEQQQQFSDSDKFKLKSNPDKERNDNRRHDKNSGEKSSKTRGKEEKEDIPAGKNATKPPVTSGPDADYDDDFDNYDDNDFEDEGEVQMSPSSTDQAATETSTTSHSSKEAAKTPTAPQDPLQQESSKIGQIHSSFINFKMAQKKCSHDLVANKMLARAFDLSRLIEMDRVSYDILEMAPVLEHSQYMRLFGKEGCQHEGSQTRDDSISREIQTEIIEERIVWTQFPALEDDVCVYVVHDSTDGAGDNTNLHCYSSPDKTASDPPDTNYTSLFHLLSLIENVLEEESSSEVTTKMPVSRDGQQPISRGYNTFSSSDNSGCILARFAVSNSNVFVTVHVQDTNAADRDKGKTPIAVWRVSCTKKEPQMYLSSPSIENVQNSIKSITFSPDQGASHVICGLNSGAIALWDLREHSSVINNQRPLPPAYLTSVSNEDTDMSHKGPIVALQPIVTGASVSSYQLISLDSLGQIFIWVISAVSQCGQWSLASGSLTDLNLRPGARYRISRTASMSTASSINGVGSFYVTSLTMDPSGNSQIFIGTNSGQIIQQSRTSHKDALNRSNLHPRILGTSQVFESGAITQLDFYPFFEPYILAGYDDGLIRIFAVGKSESILSFLYKQNVPILQLRWSRSHPSIFFSLDTEGSLCVWNVLADLYQPVHVQQLPGYIGFDLSSDSKWQVKEKNSTNNKARLLLWALDGRIEVHELSDVFSNPELDDTFKTCSLFETFV